MSTLPARCGDIARRLPDGSVRRVAFYNHNSGRVVLDGPDDRGFDLSEVEIVFQWGDWEHWRCVQQWHDGDPNDWRRRAVMFLYRRTMENPPVESRWVGETSP